MSPQLLLAPLAGGALLLIYWPTVASAFLSQEAGAEPVRIAILAPLASGWLLWQRRDRLRALAAGPWWPGLLGVAVSALGWVAGDLVGINLLRQVALVAMLIALALSVLGWRSARALALPLLFLLFCVNAFFPLVDPLMRLDAHSGVAALRLTGIPAQLNDLTISTPFGRWRVIDGCSGVDYVLIFAMCGVLFAALALRSPLRRALFVAASVLAAIFANTLRTWAIVYATYLTGSDHDHSWIGWAAFGIVFALLFAVGRHFSQSAAPARDATPPAPRPGSALGGATAALMALAIAGAAPATVSALDARSLQAAGFEGCRTADRSTSVQDGTTLVRARTECSGVAGIEQAPLLAKARFQQLAPDSVMVTDTRRIPAAGATREFDAATLTTLGSKENFRMTYWYETGGFVTGSRVAMKWHYALGRLVGRDDRVTVVMEIQAPYNPR